MARYFFHVRDGQDFRDLQGTELPTLQAAQREAVRFASVLLLERSDIFWGLEEWIMRVTDATDLTLFELRFLATLAPATLHTFKANDDG